MNAADALATFTRVQADLAEMACMISVAHAPKERTMPTIEITVPANQYADYDDCLAAAANDCIKEHKLYGWDLSPRWADDDSREEIVLSVPEFSVPLTAETITTAQIRDLRDEALDAGDRAMADICEVALGAATGEIIRPMAMGSTMTQGRARRACVDARRACVDAINNARAMQD